jgi:hypothetical protein
MIPKEALPAKQTIKWQDLAAWFNLTCVKQI